MDDSEDFLRLAAFDISGLGSLSLFAVDDAREVLCFADSVCTGVLSTDVLCNDAEVEQTDGRSGCPFIFPVLCASEGRASIEELDSDVVLTLSAESVILSVPNSGKCDAGEVSEVLCAANVSCFKDSGSGTGSGISYIEGAEVDSLRVGESTLKYEGGESSDEVDGKDGKESLDGVDGKDGKESLEYSFEDDTIHDAPVICGSSGFETSRL